MATKASRIVRVVVIIFFALAASLLGYALMNNFQFSRGSTVVVHFTSVGDLNVGAWVRKSGLKVGSVTRLQSAADETTINATVVFKPGQTVRVDDKFALVAKGILGDMYIEQRTGPITAPVAEEGRLFEGEPSFNITDLLGGSTMSSITDLASSLQAVLATLQANAGALDSSLKDIAATAKNVRIVTDRAVVLTESVPQITEQITSSINTLQQTVTNVASTTQKVLDRLQTNLDSSGDDLAASMKAVRKSTDQVQAAVEALTAQNSVIAKLSEPGTAESLAATVKNLEAISESLLSVSKDTQKIVQGVSTIFENP
jgi:phospholipid/cholesterol/gamma-HCH transport system substrate-binding protein